MATVESLPSAARPAKLPREEDPRNPNHRLAAFFDEGSVELLGPDDGSGMLAAKGTVDGATVVAFCSDATVMGGAMGDHGCRVVVDAYEHAIAAGVPVVGLWHSGGARLAEGVLSLHAVGQIFAIMTRASGKVPQISVVVGPAAGGAAYGPALTDGVILGPEGRVFVTGPDVVRSVTGEDVDALRLGGPEPHGRRSGVVHVVAETQDGAYAEARRLGGRTVGVIANNPLRLGGCLDSSSAEKAARFVRMCDAFGVPMVVVVDVPGYLPGVGQEWDGVVRRGAKLLHAFAEATVPRVTLVTRKAYGGAYIAMNSRSLGATRVLAWPSAEVAVMGAVAAVRILHRRRLAEVAPDLRAQVEAELAEEHGRIAGGLARAMEIGVIDEVVEPTATRPALEGGRDAPRGEAAVVPGSPGRGVTGAGAATS